MPWEIPQGRVATIHDHETICVRRIKILQLDVMSGTYT